MTSLDDLSMLLGKIDANIEHIRKWQENHEIANQERFQTLAERIDKANGYAVRINELECKVKEIADVVEKVEKVGWVGGGVLIGLSLVGGVFGAAMAQLAKWF